MRTNSRSNIADPVFMDFLRPLVARSPAMFGFTLKNLRTRSSRRSEMSNATIDPQRPIGELAREVPSYTRVFEAAGIDYCCGGDASLAMACNQAGVNLDDVREELADVQTDDAQAIDWDDLAELIDDVVETHHQYLREELPALEGLVRKVARVHGENHPELEALQAAYLDLAPAMKEHIREEEEEVFPIIEKLDRGDSLSDAERRRLREVIEEMEADHEETAELLDLIAELTDGYTVPADACPSYESMVERLDALERDTHEHVHKENNVLFVEAETKLSDGVESRNS
ncbi:iron-sulfur cluster repair di-iron protein [Halopenitus salinus]|uniref:Iron-sulfur cluster repair di-iron protein n=1 Tax=Halopenitus salinus TaxID=1198295 RepID=A0ABD5UPN6_9EURY